MTEGAIDPARDASARTRLLAMLAGFALCTALGVWCATPDRYVLSATRREVAALGTIDALVILAIALSAIAAEALRLCVFGRVVGVRVGVRAAFDASMANNLMSWISPGGLAGEPAAVYAMALRGVALDAALAICFAKFATSFALIYGASAVLLFAGYGPPIASWAIFSIAVAIAFGVVLCGSFVAGAIWPMASERWLDRGEAWRSRRRLLRGPLATRAVAAAVGIARRSIARLALFRTAGWSGWLAIVASHLLYYGAYVGLLVALAWMFDARSIAAIVPIAIIYQGFTFLAPAPGIPEASAFVFFGAQLPKGDALTVVLLFRALTAYLQVVLGLMYLPVIGGVIARRGAKGPVRDRSGPLATRPPRR